MSDHFGNIPGTSPMVPGGMPAQYQPQQAAAVSNIKETDLDDVEFERLEQFPDLAKGQSALLTFLLFGPKGGLRAKQVEFFYPKFGEKVYPTPAPEHNEDLMRACTKAWGLPQGRWVTIVSAWDCGPDGRPIRNEEGRFTYSLRAFRFNKTEGVWFRDTNKIWADQGGLAAHDVLRKCDAEKSVNGRSIKEHSHTVVPNKTVLSQYSPEAVEGLRRDAEEVYNEVLPFMKSLMGSARTDHEIQAMLAGVPPADRDGNGAPQGGQLAYPQPGGFMQPHQMGHQGFVNPGQSLHYGQPPTANPTAPQAAAHAPPAAPVADVAPEGQVKERRFGEILRPPQETSAAADTKQPA